MSPSKYLFKPDLNCDLGEGLDNEHLLMPYLTSCSIASGGHAGSVESIDKVIDLAVQHGVKIGAHPSYPDRSHFGRVVMDIPDRQLGESLEEQLRFFKKRAVKQNAPVNHVKPHGALYNLIAVDLEKAELVSEVIAKVFPKTKIYAPYHSKMSEVAPRFGLKVVFEAFADRNYNDDLSLVSRTNPQAVITDESVVLNHVKRMVESSRVRTMEGHMKEIKAETFCVHGDNENVETILKALKGYLY